MNEFIEVSVPDGRFHAYVAYPAVTPAPSVVVLQEIFGINADMRATCQELAAQGYVAVCPDLFWRMEPGVVMTDRTEPEWAKGFSLYTAYDLDKGVDDIVATIAAARALPQSNDRSALMGFCLGGLMTWLTTAALEVDAAVAYYPGNADKHLEVTPRIASPMLVHLAEEDEYISKDAQKAIAEALSPLPDVNVHRYPGCMHAFARHSGIHFNAEAASLANGRTAKFLADHLH
ncbi:dienelactone hydrolase family protein [soil metagenome]